MSSSDNHDYLQFMEPSTNDLMVLVAFFILLPTTAYTAKLALHAPPLGPLILGMIFGTPLTNWIDTPMQESLSSLGYGGLLLLIFHGGLTSDLRQVRTGWVRSMLVTFTGIALPIALSFLIIYRGFGYSKISAFVAGAACASTSLGTTFILLKASSLDTTRLGAVLTTAAMADDVVSLVLFRVVETIGYPDPWAIARPVVVAIALLLASWPITRFALEPLSTIFQTSFKNHDNCVLVVLALVPFAWVAAAGYAGTSVLLGAFIAGIVCSALPIREQLESTYERYLSVIEDDFLVPVFFASIGFSVPVKRMFAGKIVRRGIIYALLMTLGKVLCGVWVVVRTSQPYAFSVSFVMPYSDYCSVVPTKTKSPLPP
jgi:Kef-type K+ transport system membrane component KefB